MEFAIIACLSSAFVFGWLNRLSFSRYSISREAELELKYDSQHEESATLAWLKVDRVRRTRDDSISPNNILRRFVFPVCEELGLPRVSWLTFRRTYSTRAHDLGVPGKVAAELMGHANVYTTINTYTQVVDDSLKVAVERIYDKCRVVY